MNLIVYMKCDFICLYFFHLYVEIWLCFCCFSVLIFFLGVCVGVSHAIVNNNGEGGSGRGKKT